MKILGLDPGLAEVGYAAIDCKDEGFDVLSYGVIKTHSKELLGKRLAKIFSEVRRMVDELRPDAVAIEQIFFAANLKTAVQVAQARGVIILATTEHGLPLYEYSPLQIKRAISGYGRATKDQMQRMVAAILGLRNVRIPDDAADALASALCHAFSLKSRKWNLPARRRSSTRRLSRRDLP
jgi:crossover junction endodeoxyribonuclease RuvC